jgi:Signal transduction histidine kinase involved in nitrogen fixation and metabolism regulation
MKALTSKLGKYFIFFFLALAFYVSIELLVKAQFSEKNILSRLARSINQIEVGHHQAKEILSLQLDSLSQNSDVLFFPPLDKDVSVMAFERDSLLYWTTNNISPEKLIALTVTDDTIVNFRNGDFYTSLLCANDSLKIFLLTRLNTTYKIQNQYFRNNSLGSSFIDLNFDSPNADGQNTISVKNAEGRVLANVQLSSAHNIGQAYSYLLLFAFCLLLVLSYLLEYNMIRYLPSLQKKPLFQFLFFLIISSLSTYLLNLFAANSFLFQTEIFTVACVSTSVFPAFSAGLLTEILLLVSFNLLVFCNMAQVKQSSLRNGWRLVLASFFYIFSYAFYLHIIKMLFLNVTETFSILLLYDQTAFNYLIFILMGLITIMMIMVQRSLFHYFGPFEGKAIFIVAIFAVIMLCVYLLTDIHVYYGWLSLVLAIVLYYLLVDSKIPERMGEIVATLFQLVLYSILLTHYFNLANMVKENEEMKQTAARLTDERDYLFEKSFSSFNSKLLKDSVLINLLLSEDQMLEEQVIDYVQNKLFDSVMMSYNVTLTVCAPGEDLIIQPDDFITGCEGYFANIIATNEGEAVEDNFFYIDYNSLDPNYLAMLKVTGPDSTQVRTAYFEFYKSIAPEGIGYPRLLRDNSSPIPPNYSVACYKNNVLVYKYGSYIYPNFLMDMHFRPDAFYLGKHMKHYADCSRDSKTLIVTKNRTVWTADIAPFSYFFFELLVIYLLFSVTMIQKRGDKSNKNSFRHKLQLFILLTLGISFLVIGPVSVLYMQSIYNKKNRDFHYERTRTVLLEMNNDVDFEQLLENYNAEEIDAILQHYNRTFFTDINLYGVDGKLISTTRSEIFDNDLQAGIMDAEAFRNMRNERSLYYVQNEYLGKGSYQSAYMTLLDKNGKTLAFLNLPYFSGEAELKSEISNYVMTYVNIILFFIGFSALILIWLSKRLTKPLALIQSKMRDVRIDQTNEPIDWKSKDEIGELITQYNQLIKELEKSASLIARSERETAWRSMARQVAHEIKNPLTPMRLSIQYLQKAWDEKAPDIAEKLRKTTNTLIEQIDTLSEIASAFSNYAKLPENKLELLDLSQIVKGVVNLYNTESNITIDYQYDPDENYSFNGDKNNLGRAIGNILKNAIQAIGKKPEGRILVNLEAAKQKFVIRIADNGKGIKESEKKMIFLPNFTTKSSGMGVGLSIVYNIIQSAEGKISFESEENVGTVFTIELPKNALKQ